ncbi:MAG: hypothetical protein AAF732_01260 [Pseudomonadota bacterium]
MEALNQLMMALGASAAIISLFTVLQIVTRSPSVPGWLTHAFPVTVLALILTIGMAASLYVLASSLQHFVPGVLAIIGTCVVHLMWVAICRMMFPVDRPVVGSADLAAA